MKECMDSIVNISPVLFFATAIGLMVSFIRGDKTTGRMFYSVFIISSVIIGVLIEDGYGSYAISFLLELILMMIYTYFSCDCLNGLKKSTRHIEGTLLFVGLIACNAHFLFKRAVLESLNADENSAKTIIDANLLTILNDDWIKGICIGTISAVAGGLILNKLTRR